MVFPDHQVTYAGLAERADFFARGLLAAGLKPGETVGILLPNCADAIAALFGAAKAGLYPVPVNARYKSLELADLIRHSRMRLLFISPPSPAAPDFPALLSAAFPALDGQDRTALALDDAPDLRQVVVLGESAPPGFATEADFAAAGRVPDGDLQLRRQLVEVRDPAVLMYTSGTAAEPKGALLSHEALVRFADGAKQTRFFLTPEDRFWDPLPMFHIGGIVPMLGPPLRRCDVRPRRVLRPDLALHQLARRALHGRAIRLRDRSGCPSSTTRDFADRDLSSVRVVQNIGVAERLRDLESRHAGCRPGRTSFGTTECVRVTCRCAT